jgi:hypothetical protein
MSWTYDIYRHVRRSELRLVVRTGSQLPSRILQDNWKLVGQQQAISRIEAAEIQRSGFAISKPRAQTAKAEKARS